jgi:hypothetical protein
MASFLFFPAKIAEAKVAPAKEEKGQSADQQEHQQTVHT